MLLLIITENGVKKIKPLTADAGAGLPVGFMSFAYKKGNYSGWLYCDGRDTTGTSEELSTHYPLLYAYLGSNVLPDYREVAPTGAEKNTTDTIETHDVFTEGQFKDDQVQTHSHSIAALTASGGNNSTLTNNASTYRIDSTGNNATGRYGTVTRGKRKAVYYYIKATSGLSENAQDNVVAQLNEQRSYSTEEHLTGKKWIDGKKIYSKTVDCGALPNDTTKYVAHGISNLGFVVDLYGISSNNDVYLPIPLVSKASVSSNIGVFINGANISIEAGIDRSSFSNTYITIEYTKTTD